MTLSWSLYPGWRADTELVSDWVLTRGNMTRLLTSLTTNEIQVARVLPVSRVDWYGEEGGDGGVCGGEDGGGDITVRRERNPHRLQSLCLE